VLYPLKTPDMFVTFCFVACSEDGLQFGLAGHPAILHFSAKTKEVMQLECSNLPLGILPVAEFATSEYGRRRETCWRFTWMGYSEPRTRPERNLE
jgi:serine phosphatase RsbU (regulator of sigma subunit)